MAHHRIVRATAASVSTLGLVVGMAGFAGASPSTSTSGTNKNTGPNSTNRIVAKDTRLWFIQNDNELEFENENEQDAESGDVESMRNTRAGSARSGHAKNDNKLWASIVVNNASGGGSGASKSSLRGTNQNTGHDSFNVVRSSNFSLTDIDNDNEIEVENENDQWARSGDVTSSRNTNGGSATSGDASNTNRTSVEVKVYNSAPSSSGGSSSTTGTNQNTGPDSTNVVRSTNTSKTFVNNDNDIEVENENEQDAESGDVTSTRNTNGGSATSGDASNTNTSSFSISVKN